MANAHAQIASLLHARAHTRALFLFTFIIVLTSLDIKLKHCTEILLTKISYINIHKTVSFYLPFALVVLSTGSSCKTPEVNVRSSFFFFCASEKYFEYIFKVVL